MVYRVSCEEQGKDGGRATGNRLINEEEGERRSRRRKKRKHSSRRRKSKERSRQPST